MIGDFRTVLQGRLHPKRLEPVTLGSVQHVAQFSKRYKVCSLNPKTLYIYMDHICVYIHTYIYTYIHRYIIHTVTMLGFRLKTPSGTTASSSICSSLYLILDPYDMCQDFSPLVQGVESPVVQGTPDFGKQPMQGYLQLMKGPQP